MITTLSFDGDNTLWDFQKVMRHSLECVRHELMHFQRLSTLTVDEMIRIRNEVAQSLESKTTNLEEIRLSAFRETLRRYGIIDEGLAKKLNALYLKHRFEDIELFPDVSSAFQSLGRNYRLGLLSNGNSYPEKCGLKDVFEFAIFSQDHGVKKPDPKIFEITLSTAKCGRDEMIHVGDKLDDDIGGAQSAGIKSVWLNRNREANETGIIPDFEITSLQELPEILSNENHQS
jgi:putative hydrolase of the HAD superfamily